MERGQRRARCRLSDERERPGEARGLRRRNGGMGTGGVVAPEGVHSRPAVGPVACERLGVMLREFDAQLQKGDNPGAWTCVVMDDAAELFGTRDS